MGLNVGTDNVGTGNVGDAVGTGVGFGVGAGPETTSTVAPQVELPAHPILNLTSLHPLSEVYDTREHKPQLA